MPENLSWKQLHTTWLLLGVIFAVVDYFIIKPTGAGFTVAMVYAVSALVVGELSYLAIKKGSPNIWAMLVGSLVASLPIVVSISTFDPTTALWIVGGGLIAVWALNAQESFGERNEKAGVLAVVPMAIWVLWGLIFIQQRMNDPTGLPWQTLIYHFGIIVFAAHSVLRFIGVFPDNEQHQKIAIYLLAFATLGALLVTQTLGAGLRIAP